jgi:hypothetical protein
MAVVFFLLAPLVILFWLVYFVWVTYNWLFSNTSQDASIAALFGWVGIWDINWWWVVGFMLVVVVVVGFFDGFHDSWLDVD